MPPIIWSRRVLPFCGRCSLGLVGFVGLTVSGLAQEQSAPAARIGRIVPMDERTQPVRARALSPAPAPEPASPRPSASWIQGPVPTTIRPLPLEAYAPGGSAAAPRNLNAHPNGNSSRSWNPDAHWQSLKGFLQRNLGLSESGVVSPSPNPGSSGDRGPRGVDLVVSPSANVWPGPAPGVYAGPPAYRWYGYGTTTPGKNPLAPQGVSPQGSSQWYSQTGATPGAFPVTGEALVTRPQLSGPPSYGPPAVAPLTQNPIRTETTATPLLPGRSTNLTTGIPPSGWIAGAPPLPPGAIVIADGIPVPPSGGTDLAPGYLHGSPTTLGWSNAPAMPAMVSSPALTSAPPVLGVGQPIPAGMAPFPMPTQPNWPGIPPSTTPLPIATAPGSPGVKTNPVSEPVRWQAVQTAPVRGGVLVRPQAPSEPGSSWQTRLQAVTGAEARILRVVVTGLSRYSVILEVRNAQAAETVTAKLAALPWLKAYQVDFHCEFPDPAGQTGQN